MVPFKKKSDSITKSCNAKSPISNATTNTTPTSNNNNNCTTTTSPPSDDFSARRSARVAVGEYAADNDTWVEALAVCELPRKAGGGGTTNSGNGKSSGLLSKFKSSSKKKHEMDDSSNSNTTNNIPEEDLASASQRLTLRPYFQSQNTGQRVWDEPPSGASTILYATAEARKMAQAQLEEMRNTYANAAVRRRLEREELKVVKEEKKLLQRQSNGGGKSSGGVLRLSRLFKKTGLVSEERKSSNNTISENDDENDQHGDDDALLLNYSQGITNQNNDTTTNNTNNSNRKPKAANNNNGMIPKSILQESKEMARSDLRSKYEEELQMAMMLSMNMGGGSVMGVGDCTVGNASSGSGSEACHHATTTKPPPLVSALTPSYNNDATSMSLEEQEQLAMALSLSEQQQHDNEKASSSRGYMRRKSSKKNEYTSISDSLDDEYGDDGGGKMPAIEWVDCSCRRDFLYRLERGSVACFNYREGWNTMTKGKLLAFLHILLFQIDIVAIINENELN